jgi:deoxynucleoside kinase
MYIVEGTIGAGKSTFLTTLMQNCSNISVALEPVNNWQKQVEGQSLLTSFYENPKRWAYTLETFVMSCRIRDYIQEQQVADKFAVPTRLIERSIYSGYYCFAKNSYESGFMTALEWYLYQEWFHFLTSGICHPPRGFIYIRVAPEIAYARIKKRNRPSEQNITLSYLKDISQKHEDFLVNKLSNIFTLSTVPVLIIDANNDFEHNIIEQSKHKTSIQTFITDIERGQLEQQKNNLMLS